MSSQQKIQLRIHQDPTHTFALRMGEIAQIEHQYGLSWYGDHFTLSSCWGQPDPPPDLPDLPELSDKKEKKINCRSVFQSVISDCGGLVVFLPINQANLEAAFHAILSLAKRLRSLLNQHHHELSWGRGSFPPHPSKSTAYTRMKKSRWWKSARIEIKFDNKSSSWQWRLIVLTRTRKPSILHVSQATS